MNCDGNTSMRGRAAGQLTLGLTILGGLARLIPHPLNFTPVGGMSLFAGARLAGWQAYALPLVLMAVTDPIVAAIYGIPAFDGATAFVYLSFLINVWIGRRLRGSDHIGRIGVAVLLCSVQFFLITNAAVWLVGGLYPHTAAGFVACYVAAIPFFGRTLAGDVLYSGLLFGLHAWLRRVLPSESQVLAKSPSAA